MSEPAVFPENRKHTRPFPATAHPALSKPVVDATTTDVAPARICPGGWERFEVSDEGASVVRLASAVLSV